MTTERHVWTGSVGQRVRPEVCGCGQDLDLCAGCHCPRCGTHLSEPARDDRVAA